MGISESRMKEIVFEGHLQAIKEFKKDLNLVSSQEQSSNSAYRLDPYPVQHLQCHLHSSVSHTV